MTLTPELVDGLNAIAAHGQIGVLVVDADGRLLASVSPPNPRCAVMLLVGVSAVSTPRSGPATE